MVNCVALFLNCTSALPLTQSCPSNVRTHNLADSYFQDKRRQSASSDPNEPTKPATATCVVSPEYAPRSPITLEEDRGNEWLVHAVKLLASRERVLTLSEQQAWPSFAIHHAPNPD
jgi:hypothetical protein